MTWTEESNSMDAEAVLATARSGSVPSDWNVWPLRQDRVRRAILGWGAVALVGFALFIPALLQTIPGNFAHGGVAVVCTGLFLLALAAVAFGGLGVALYDVWRLAHVDEFLLVMTPDDFVKAEPGKVIHVPMDKIAYITLRGVKPPESAQQATARTFNTFSQYPGGFGRLVGSTSLRRKPAQAPSLAFVDTRDDREVVVATDDSFDALIALDEVLHMHVEAKERRLRSG
jgi:hypothetical protein